jgi:cytosine/creatinine deaminase
MVLRMEAASMDLVLRNVLLKDRRYERFDIGIAGDRIREISPRIEARGALELDGGGGLAAPSFVDSHSHLDKAMMVYMSPPAATGTLAESFARGHAAKRRSSIPDVIARATEAIRTAVANGTGAIRVHSEVDATWGITGIEGLLEVKKAVSSYLDLQVLPLPTQNPLDDATRKLVRMAMDAGANAIGGSPHLEYTPPDVVAYVDFIFDLAKDYDAAVDLHVDQEVDATSYTRALEHILVKTMREGYEGRVTVNHCGALAAYEPRYRARIIDLMKRAGVNFVMCPKEELIIQGMGSAPVQEMLAAGVNCAYAHNNCADTFSPYGRLDMLDAGLLAIHVGGFTNKDDADKVLDMGTVNPARIMGLEGYGIAEGNKAHLNVFDAPSAYEAFRQCANRRFVIRSGKLVAESRAQKLLHL